MSSEVSIRVKTDTTAIIALYKTIDKLKARLDKVKAASKSLAASFKSLDGTSKKASKSTAAHRKASADNKKELKSLGVEIKAVTKDLTKLLNNTKKGGDANYQVATNINKYRQATKRQTTGIKQVSPAVAGARFRQFQLGQATMNTAKIMNRQSGVIGRLKGAFNSLSGRVKKKHHGR